MTADPALAYARPDVEWICHSAVAHLGGTVTWADGARPLGAAPAGWLAPVDIRVEARAASKAAARLKGDAVRRAVCGLPWDAVAGAAIARADVLSGPWWDPDDTGAPRYVTRFRVWVHPARGPVAVPAAAGPRDPALGYEMPDAEWLVREALRPLGGSTAVWAFAVTPGQPRGWLSVTDLQVDVRAATKRHAYRQADVARLAVCKMPFAAGGQVSDALVTDGPLWVPDGPGQPRYVVRFALTVHAARRGVKNGAALCPQHRQSSP